MPRSSMSFSNRLAVVRIAVALAALLGSLRIAPGAAQFIDPLDVIAQGVVELQTDPLVWQVREIIYPTSFDSDAPGFVASMGPTLVIRVGDKSATAAQVGQVAFAERGFRHIKAGTAGESGKALEFSLVPAPGNPDIAGQLTGISEAFSLPDADAYDLEFVTGSISSGATVPLPAGDGPALVMASSGAVQVEPQAAPFHRLQEGEFALAENGGLLRANVGEPADVIVIRMLKLDDEPPAARRPTPIPSPLPAELATIEVQVRGCPKYAPTDDMDAMQIACTRAIGGFDVGVGRPSVASSRTDRFGHATLEGIPPGTYDGGGGFMGDIESYLGSCRDEDGNAVSSPERLAAPIEIVVAPGAQITCDWYVVPYDARGSRGSGSIEFRVTRCPVGYEGRELERDCSDPVDGLFLSLDGETGASGYTRGGAIGFTGLPRSAFYELTAGIEADDRTLFLDCRSKEGVQLAVPIHWRLSGVLLPAEGVVTCNAYAMDVDLWRSLEMSAR